MSYYVLSGMWNSTHTSPWEPLWLLMLEKVHVGWMSCLRLATDSVIAVLYM